MKTILCKAIAVALFVATMSLLLWGCGEAPSASDRAAQQLGTAEIACRGGVEYLMMPTTHGFYTATPHLQPDGRPFLCVKMQSPVDE